MAHYYVSQGNLPDAVQLFKLAANQNSTEAQFELCRLYHQGQGVTVDFSQALEWCLRAANEGDTVAQTYLGEIYRTGDTVEQDHAKAAQWFLAAAERGHRMAQTALSDLYELGLGVRQSNEAAFKWLWLAASRGHAEAQMRLGDRYLRGEIVPRDFAEALKWSQRAVRITFPGDFGYRQTLFRIGTMHACGWDIPIDDEKARQWFVRAEREGDDLSTDSDAIIRMLEAIEWPRSQAGRRRGLCTQVLDEAYGSTVEEPESTETEPGANSCTWANDGECDEPNVCSPGTDTNDCNQPRMTVSPTERLSESIYASLLQRATPIVEDSGFFYQLTCEPSDVTLIHVEGNRYVGTVEYLYSGSSRMREATTGNAELIDTFSCNVEVISDGNNYMLYWERDNSCLSSPMNTEGRPEVPPPDWQLDFVTTPAYMLVESCYCIEPKTDGRCERLDYLLDVARSALLRE